MLKHDSILCDREMSIYLYIDCHLLDSREVCFARRIATFRLKGSKIIQNDHNTYYD